MKLKNFSGSFEQSFISNCTKLTGLSIRHNDPIKFSLKSSAVQPILTNLTKLTLQCACEPLDFKQCNKLFSLNVGKFLVLKIEEIAAMIDLQKLKFASDQKEDKTLEPLKNLYKIRTLSIYAPELLLERLPLYLCKMSHLSSLELEVKSVTRNSLLALGQLSFLPMENLRIVEKIPTDSKKASLLKNLYCQEFYYESSNLFYDLEELPEIPKVCAKCARKYHTMHRCGGCQLQYYCSQQCQKNDWKQHHDWCKQKKRSTE